ncbi:MAG: hypothetical protein ACREJ3_18130 [Polyangiaceae bacterium]
MRPLAQIGVCLAALASLLAPARARATVTWMPGESREISRDTSASRDAPVSGLVFAPRVSAKGAADFALAAMRFGGVSLRPGFEAFFELEHADVGLSGPLPLPGQGRGPMLWRGYYGGSLALSAERLARAWLGARGAIEVAVTVGHESGHVTGGSFDDAPDPGDITAGGGGEFAIYDVAVRVPVSASVDVWGRIGDRAYFRGPILHAPGLGGGLRWHLAPHLEPVVSVFGEALLVNHNLNEARDGGFAGLLAGLALPGELGELIPYVAAAAGNGKGLLINRREIDLSIGVRYAPR